MNKFMRLTFAGLLSGTLATLILMLLFIIASLPPHPFTDTPINGPGTWVSRAYNEGLIAGYGDDQFGPYDPLTRGQLCVLTVRLHQGTDFEPVSDGEIPADLINHWAEDWCDEALDLSLILTFEDGTFRPDSPITRLDAMSLIYH